MSYYDDRRYHAPRDRGRPASGYAADYYDDHPRGRYARRDRDPYPYYRDDGSVEEIPRDFPPVGIMSSSAAMTRGGRRAVQYTKLCVGRHLSAVIRTTIADIIVVPVLPDPVGPRRSKYDSASESSRSPPRHSRRKSISEAALGALGLGAASKSSDRSYSRHGQDRGRSYSRHGRYSSDSRSRSRDRGRHSSKREKSEQRIMQAARAALTAGAAEAFRSRKDPGEWTGEKGRRVLTAAVTSAATDGLVDKDPKKHGTRHVIESTLAGLATSHLVNGGRSSSRGRDGRGRSSGGIKNLAATGALAAAGKEIYDRFSRSRSRPRGRDERDDDSRYSDDERRGSRKRSKSVSDYINKGIAALGLDEGKDRGSRDRSRDRSKDRDDRSDRRERRHHRDDRRDRDRDSRYDGYSGSDADSDYGRGYSRRGRGSRDVGRTRSLNGGRVPPYSPTSAPRSAGSQRPTSRGDDCSCSDSDSDLGDSSDEKKMKKKMRRDMLLTSGLATVASIHAAHGVYGSVNKRKLRMKQLKEGEITPEEARKQRIKANTLDAASIGLAALGIKGAYGEWKEVNEKRKENNNFQHECVRRAMKRELKRNRSNSMPSYHRWPDEIEENAYSGGHGSFSYHDGNPYGATTEAPAISY
ncbi:hypothetical protein N7532_005938 [Penicillium argentinense]|uniref:DUF3824 domain-containing protein n=1 Tax=Penicillium argentinense TaxID=1131581 RepID=A0A9W9FEX7_9EURO|nr:uncharacterized protein N7532_005938 [Penicillium argentinense]KAJ5098937.1 hypothetical protein N7532_005938 [Penicillium argentinense]